MSTPTSAAAVANFFLDQGDQESVGIRQLKIQKLVYFAYAWYAGNKNEELFEEDFEAWQYGPVVRDLYVQFRDFGRSYITSRATKFDPESNREVAAEVKDGDALTLLKKIWGEYGRKNDSWLVGATHQPGEPWSIFVNASGGPNKRRIPFELIQRVYSQKVAQLD